MLYYNNYHIILLVISKSTRWQSNMEKVSTMSNSTMQLLVWPSKM